MTSWFLNLRSAERWRVTRELAPMVLSIFFLSLGCAAIALLLAIKAGFVSSEWRGFAFRQMVAALLAGSGIYYWDTQRESRKRIRWLTSRVNAISDSLKPSEHVGDAHGQPNVPNPEATRWPWGSHHTEHLGHLEAAASKWWINYDPAQPDTAPTNDMVSEWLTEHRGISKDKAKAIASILRPDGLKTGPRR